VIGAAHIISKTGQAAYREFIIVARTAAEFAQMPYYKTMSERRVAEVVPVWRTGVLLKQ
jgi:hypothetical protein